MYKAACSSEQGASAAVSQIILLLSCVCSELLSAVPHSCSLRAEVCSQGQLSLALLGASRFSPVRATYVNRIQKVEVFLDLILRGRGAQPFRTLGGDGGAL